MESVPPGYTEVTRTLKGRAFFLKTSARPSSPYAYADNYDENVGRYRGLRVGQNVSLVEEDVPGLLI